MAEVGADNEPRLRAIPQGIQDLAHFFGGGVADRKGDAAQDRLQERQLHFTFMGLVQLLTCGSCCVAMPPSASPAGAQEVWQKPSANSWPAPRPSHYVEVEGLATSSAEAFATPLGLLPVDVEAVRQARALPQVRELDEAHEHEHSLEVQLPFLQTVLGDFALVPLAVGDATPEEVGQVLDTLWDGPETRFVISSDLSHYYDFQTARRLDAATAKAIEALKPGGVIAERACGRIPICGLLQAASRHGLRARTVDLRNSGDTAGPRDKVVGYGAFVFESA